MKWIISLTALLLLPIPSSAMDNTWQNPTYIHKAFIEIALKNEYRKTDMRLIRWHRPIRYQFIYEGTRRNTILEALTRTQMSHLSEITSHPILEATNPNFRIIFTTDNIYSKTIKKYVHAGAQHLARESNCMGSFNLNDDNAIVSATVIIPTDHAFSKGLFVSCVIEETTQLMGLPNDSDWVNPSIANDASLVEFLTGLDFIMLKLLYSPDLYAGMPLNQLKPVLYKNIRRLMINRTIKRANFLVNKKGLFKALN